MLTPSFQTSVKQLSINQNKQWKSKFNTTNSEEMGLVLQ